MPRKKSWNGKMTQRQPQGMDAEEECKNVYLEGCEDEEGSSRQQMQTYKEIIKSIQKDLKRGTRKGAKTVKKDNKYAMKECDERKRIGYANAEPTGPPETTKAGPSSSSRMDDEGSDYHPEFCGAGPSGIREGREGFDDSMCRDALILTSSEDKLDLNSDITMSVSPASRESDSIMAEGGTPELKREVGQQTEPLNISEEAATKQFAEAGCQTGLLLAPQRKRGANLSTQVTDQDIERATASPLPETAPVYKSAATQVDCVRPSEDLASSPGMDVGGTKLPLFAYLGPKSEKKDAIYLGTSLFSPSAMRNVVVSASSVPEYIKRAAEVLLPKHEELNTVLPEQLQAKISSKQKTVSVPQQQLIAPKQQVQTIKTETQISIAATSKPVESWRSGTERSENGSRSGSARMIHSESAASPYRESGIVNDPILNPLDCGEEPILINAKQYHRIMIRRAARLRMEAEGRISSERRPYMHESRHKQALRRHKQCRGKFRKIEKPGETQQTASVGNVAGPSDYKSGSRSRSRCRSVPSESETGTATSG